MDGTVSITEMQDKADELAARLGEGETIVVTRDGKPLFDLVPHRAEPAAAPRRGGLNWAALEAYKQKHGIDKLVLRVADDFDAPMTEEEFLTVFEPGT